MYDYRKLSDEECRVLAAERRAKGFPMHAPPHVVRDRSLYLLTAACYEHAPHMHTPARREALRRTLSEQLGREYVKAWVVLPNHYHVLVRVPDFEFLGGQIRRMHGPLARQWNQEDEAPGRKVWYRYADHAVRSARHYAVTLNYIHTTRSSMATLPRPTTGWRAACTPTSSATAGTGSAPSGATTPCEATDSVGTIGRACSLE